MKLIKYNKASTAHTMESSLALLSLYNQSSGVNVSQNLIGQPRGDKLTNQITVVDARMGRGKSSAAIRYMNRYKGSKRFLYITPYLDEVGRICECCDFDQPDSDHMSKSTELKLHLRAGHNVSATHSLFYLMDSEAIDLVRERHYSLIVDESIQVIERLNVTSKDFSLITTHLSTTSDDGRLHWIDDEYDGKFNEYKEKADNGSLFQLDSALLSILNPDLLRAFDEVFMLTYLFNGQYQKAYLEYFGFDYCVVGVKEDNIGYYFSDRPDNPPPLDYTRLIHIEDSPKLNAVGENPYALSKAWYDRRKYDNPDIRTLRNSMKKFFQGIPGGNAKTRLWTCFKDDVTKLTDAKTGRFRNNYLQSSARATNQYKDRSDIAYMVNRFADPNIIKFFCSKDINIDAEQFALSEMLQWIWRSAIRDGKPINLYIPSSRMRGLLIDWINITNQGGCTIE